MNLIIGISKMPLRALIVCLLLALANGCKHGGKDDDDDESSGPKSNARIEVKVTHPVIGSISEVVTLNATTVYLINDVVRSPIAGYVKKINVTVGDIIKQGDILFTVQSKEAAAIASDTLFPSKGMTIVKAAEAGIVKSVDRQEGDYMQEGDQLCTIANNSSLVFELDVPFEMRKDVKTGEPCKIQLPGGESMQARITSQIPEMDRSVQMEKFVLRTASPLSLPEGLIANVTIPTITVAHTVILPKTAVLADETQSQFWVMKLANDSTAVKNIVVKGIESKDSVEIKSPAYTESDRILVSGNYGLPDTAHVKVVQ